MIHKTIKIDNHFIEIDEIDWIDKRANCLYNKRDCYCYESDKKCKQNKTMHCCKHYCNGEEKDVERFDIAFKRIGLDESKISNDNSVVNNDLVEMYGNLSKRLIKESSYYGVSAMREKVNIFIAGDGASKGFVDYLSLDEEGDYRRIGIVSLYPKDFAIDYYWLLVCVYAKYKEKRDGISGAQLLSLFVYDDTNRKISIDVVNKVDCAMYLAGLSSDDVDDNALGALYVYCQISSVDLDNCFKEMADILDIESLSDIGANELMHPVPECRDKLQLIIRNNKSVFNEKIIRMYIDYLSNNQIGIDDLTETTNTSLYEHISKGRTDGWTEEEIQNEKRNCELLWLKHCLIHARLYYKEHVERTLNVFIEGDSEDCRKESRSDETVEMCEEDFAAFHVVSSFFNYYITFKMYLMAYRDCKDSEPHNKQAELNQIKTFFCELDRINSRGIEKWINRFLKIYKLENCPDLF